MDTVVATPTRPDRAKYDTDRTICAPVPGVSINQVGRFPVERVIGRISSWTATGYCLPRPAPRGQLLHTYNQVPISRPDRWGITCESFLPRIVRVGALERRSFDRAAARLAEPNCRFVAPLSEHSKRLVESRLGGVYPEIASKTTVVAPWQPEVPFAVAEPAPLAGPITLGFVGRDFYRKGGEAVLRAVELVGDELDVRAVIVSPADHNDYVTRGVTGEHVAGVRRRLAGTQRVDWRESLPPADVLPMLARCTIGVLPTLADTYGFSLLEAMAVGLPVIGTNVQAGPEIVAGVGWRVDVPVDDDGYWADRDQPGTAHYVDAMACLTDGIVAALRELRDRPGLAETYGRAALAKIEQKHRRDRTERMRQLLVTS